MRNHSILREGAVAGIIGATVVAVWFLVVDMVSNELFHTPDLLGRSVLSIFGSTADDSRFMVVSLYTLFHYGAFILAGMLAVAVVHAGLRESSVLAGALILFVAFELGFYGMMALLSQSDAIGSLAWYQIGLANLLAAVAMGTYLWRTHPRLGGQFAHALGGGER